MLLTGNDDTTYTPLTTYVDTHLDIEKLKKWAAVEYDEPAPIYRETIWDRAIGAVMGIVVLVAGLFILAGVFYIMSINWYL